MFSPKTTALLRAVHEEVCENIPASEVGARTHVALKILEAAAQGKLSTDALRTAGLKALTHDVGLILGQPFRLEGRTKTRAAALE